MKMAKASEADLNTAMDLCGAIDAISGPWPSLPAALCSEDPNEQDGFDPDDDRQCGQVLRHLIELAERGSLMRVVFGCAVMLDPRNRLVDPDADTIERHPDFLRMREAIQSLLDDPGTDRIRSSVWDQARAAIGHQQAGKAEGGE